MKPQKTINHLASVVAHTHNPSTEKMRPRMLRIRDQIGTNGKNSSGKNESKD